MVIKRLNALLCYTAGATVKDPFTVIVYDSNDKSEWKPLAMFSNLTFVSSSLTANGAMTDYNVDSDTPYMHYRIEFNQGYGGITEIDFFGTLW